MKNNVLTQTYQTRIFSSTEDLSLLREIAKLLSQVERNLFADLVQKKSINLLKSEYIARFGITARQFNACRVLIEGKMRSVSTLQKENLSTLNERTEYLEQRIEKISSSSNKKKLYRFKQSLSRSLSKRIHLEEKVKQEKVSICFGTKKLFKAQFHLEESGFASHLDWKNAWEAKRNSEFFTLGSKDEAGGNQTCTPFVEIDGSISLRLRIPDSLVKESNKYLWIKNVQFSYGQTELIEAIREGQIRNHLQKSGDKTFKNAGRAISFRFLLDEKGCRIFATTDIPERKTVSKMDLGVVGVDINNDHLAISETDRYGNLIETMRIPLMLYGKSTAQTKAIIGDACKAVVEFALQRKKPIALEELDFQKKKTSLKNEPSAYKRMLSSFSYRQIINGIESQSFKKGIQVGKVNPAFTSLIGKLKYAQKYGISNHHAAALCIARRMQKFSENLPRQTMVPTRKGTHMAFSVPVRNPKKSQVSHLREVGKKLQATHVEYFLEMKNLSSSSSKRAFVSNHPKIVGEIPTRESLAELLG